MSNKGNYINELNKHNYKERFIKFLTESATSKDYVDDFKLENGTYTCICTQCNSEFIGYKRRLICKECNDSKETN